MECSSNHVRESVVHDGGESNIELRVELGRLFDQKRVITGLDCNEDWNKLWQGKMIRSGARFR